MKTLNEIYEDYLKGCYRNPKPYPLKPNLPKDGIFNENKSVKWNRAEFDRHIKAHNESQRKWTEEDEKLQSQLRFDVVDSVISEYGISHEKSWAVEAYVWRKYHSCVDNYISMIKEIVEFALKFQSA